MDCVLDKGNDGENRIHETLLHPRKAISDTSNQRFDSDFCQAL
eukprot:SAG11_NODE_15714_length_568_cov_1.484009_1_plen_42_part_01